MSDDFKFLFKPRFWSMVMAAAGGTLLDPGFPNQTWYISLGKFLVILGGAFTAVGTIDRNFGDKKVEASKIQAGFSATDAATPTPPAPASAPIQELP
jgi:hypothetical protein